MGRPTLLTPTIQQEIVTALEAGAYAHDAALNAGIAESTYYSWTARGRAEQARLTKKGTRPRKSEAPYVEFVEACARASARAKVTALARIRTAALGPKGNWKAEAWFLERRFPAEFGRRAHLELAGSETGGPVQIVGAAHVTVHDGTGDDEVAKAAHEFLRAAGARRRGGAGPDGEPPVDAAD